MKSLEIFLIVNQYIDGGYSVKSPQSDGSNKYLQSMF